MTFGGIFVFAKKSLSARRAWIEIYLLWQFGRAFWSLSARRAWIEIGANADSVSQWTASLSARRAWIEIFDSFHYEGTTSVALRKESVDRNCRNNLTERRHWVALRKESVDRNKLRGA